MSSSQLCLVIIAILGNSLVDMKYDVVFESHQQRFHLCQPDALIGPMYKSIICPHKNV